MPTPLTLLACEPVIPLVLTFAGPGMMLSYAWKTGAILAAVVARKSFLFSRTANIGPTQGFVAMLIANLFTTGIGILVGGCLAVPPLAIGGVPLLAATSWTAAILARSHLVGTSWERLRPALLVPWTVLLASISLVAFSLIGNPLETPGFPVALYWLLKLAGYFTGFAASLALTIAWEGIVVVGLSPAGSDRERLLQSTIRANLQTFLIVFSIGAAIAIPHRLRQPGFLWSGED